VRRSSPVGLAVFAIIAIGCDRGNRTSNPAAPATVMSARSAEDATCPRCSPPATMGSVSDSAIDELSGIVTASTQADVLFVHNDSGDSARFFAIDPTGALLARFKVNGAKAIDWEDIARGPCAPPAAASCLYLADIGDNTTSRDEYAVYRVPEPEGILPVGGEPARAELAADALRFVYPDGKHNAEALLVHPSTGVITIVTKRKTGASGIYEMPMPLRAGERVTLVKVGEIAPPTGINLFTGGDVDPKASGVLLRTYTSVFYYPMSAGQSVAQALTGPPCILPAAVEQQGEAIAFTPSGKGYYTASEGNHPEVHLVSCEASRGAP
jgi:hypothetical protein